MALQSIININIDFYDKKHILINAKQLDKKSRFLSVTCYNHGELYPINAGEHSAYIRYKKSDDYSVFNFCEIDRKGKILVELTEQMLVSEGICYADLVIVNKGSAKVDTETGEIVAINNTSILSTMTFCIDVSESAIANSDIESSYEYDGLNKALEKAEAEYSEVIQLARSYAIGDAGGIRKNEDVDNSKYYSQQSFKSAGESEASALNAANSEENAETYMHNSLTYSQNSQTYMSNSKTYMNNAQSHMDNAKTYMDNAKTYMDNAKTSETNAKASEDDALNYSIISQRYAVGGTNSVEDEETDNSKYYYGQIKSVYNGLDGSLSPKGTITFEELETAEKFTGALYVISESFVTDETFADGEDVTYPAGTLVYYTVDGLWACFDGVKADVATVDEVKTYLGI